MWTYMYHYRNNQGQIQKIQKEGAKSQTLHPAFQEMQHTACGRIHDAELKCLYGPQDFYSYGSSIMCKKVF